MSAAADTLTLRNAQQPELLEAVGWIDARVRDAFGQRVGRVSAVFADRNGHPWWVVVSRRGHMYLAPVTAIDSAPHHELRLTCPKDDLWATDGSEISAALHEALIRRFGLDRRHTGPRARGDCGPLRERRRFRSR